MHNGHKMCLYSSYCLHTFQEPSLSLCSLSLPHFLPPSLPHSLPFFLVSLPPSLPPSLPLSLSPSLPLSLPLSLPPSLPPSSLLRFPCVESDKILVGSDQKYEVSPLVNHNLFIPKYYCKEFLSIITIIYICSFFLHI